MADGTEVDKTTVTKLDDWKYSFTNLPKYKDGEEIVYSITEDAVQDYSAAYDGYNVTNTHETGKTSITVTKKWIDVNDKDGIRPDSVTIKLYRDGKDTGKSLKLTKNGKWMGSFTDLDQYSNGELVEYTVKEADVSGYTAAVAGSMEKGFIITNTHKPVEKTPTPKTPGNSRTTTPKRTTTRSLITKITSPQTGDTAEVRQYGLLMLASAAVLMILRSLRKRKEQSEND
jgi:hypothetical protein